MKSSLQFLHDFHTLRLLCLLRDPQILTKVTFFFCKFSRLFIKQYQKQNTYFTNFFLSLKRFESTKTFKVSSRVSEYPCFANEHRTTRCAARFKFIQRRHWCFYFICLHFVFLLYLSHICKHTHTHTHTQYKKTNKKNKKIKYKKNENTDVARKSVTSNSGIPRASAVVPVSIVFPQNMDQVNEQPSTFYHKQQKANTTKIIRKNAMQICFFVFLRFCVIHIHFFCVREFAIFDLFFFILFALM